MRKMQKLVYSNISVCMCQSMRKQKLDKSGKKSVDFTAIASREECDGKSESKKLWRVSCPEQRTGICTRLLYHAGGADLELWTGLLCTGAFYARQPEVGEQPFGRRHSLDARRE